MKKYGLLSILFLLLSLFGGIYLVKNTQDNRNQAIDGCWATCNCSCGVSFCADPKGRGCHYECLDKCGEISNYGSFTDDPCNQVNATSKCLTAKSGTMDVVNHYKCPGETSISAAGCTKNVKTYRNTNSVCVDESLCGVQQIDYQNCFVSYLKICKKPTSPPETIRDSATPTKKRTPTKKSTLVPSKKPTSTLVPTATNTPKPTLTTTPAPTATNTPKPTLTTTPAPTATNTPKPTPTPTPGPTSTPVPPTNTPVPTSVIAQGPSPTRIVLPQSGVEFPSQMLTIIGGIITLLGFLILL